VSLNTRGHRGAQVTGGVQGNLGGCRGEEGNMGIVCNFREIQVRSSKV